PSSSCSNRSLLRPTFSSSWLSLSSSLLSCWLFNFSSTRSCKTGNTTVDGSHSFEPSLPQTCWFQMFQASRLADGVVNSRMLHQKKGVNSLSQPSCAVNNGPRGNREQNRSALQNGIRTMRSSSSPRSPWLPSSSSLGGAITSCLRHRYPSDQIICRIVPPPCNFPDRSRIAPWIGKSQDRWQTAVQTVAHSSL
ncbi:mCG146207, partial [Mus musculus]